MENLFKISLIDIFCTTEEDTNFLDLAMNSNVIIKRLILTKYRRNWLLRYHLIAWA